jgi:hypothetical protein
VITVNVRRNVPRPECVNVSEVGGLVLEGKVSREKD